MVLPPGKLLQALAKVVRASVSLPPVLLRTVYSQTQGCICTALQLGGDVEQPWLMNKNDAIHETGSTQRITAPPEEDRATATGNMHAQKNLVKIGRVVPKI